MLTDIQGVKGVNLTLVGIHAHASPVQCYCSGAGSCPSWTALTERLLVGQ